MFPSCFGIQPKQYTFLTSINLKHCTAYIKFLQQNLAYISLPQYIATQFCSWIPYLFSTIAPTLHRTKTTSRVKTSEPPFSPIKTGYGTPRINSSTRQTGQTRVTNSQTAIYESRLMRCSPALRHLAETICHLQLLCHLQKCQYVYMSNIYF